MLLPLMIAGLLCLGPTVLSENTWAQEVPPPENVMVTTRLDHTAVWIGDQFHYVIMVDHPSNYEFVLDNLTRETVNMDPFQVVDVSHNLVVQKNNSQKLFVDLTLADFVTNMPTMQIPQFTLYYFEKDQRTTGPDQAEAQSLTIRGPVIGIRSSLLPMPEDIRDTMTVTSWDRSRWVLPAVAWVCGAVLVIGVGWELAMFVKRMRTHKGPDRRKAMQAVRTQWLSGVPSEFTDPKTCLSFYDNSYRNLKQYIEYYLETPTMGLTSEEIREEMKRLGAEPDLTLKVVRVLETCETLRYTPGGVSANGAAGAVAQDMREILSAKR